MLIIIIVSIEILIFGIKKLLLIFLTDPTAGPSEDNKNQWWMDEKALRDNVRKMLSKFCGPAPFVLEEAYNLQFASTAPPTAAEW